MGTYGPMAAAGLGIMGLTGGFKADSGQGITAEDRKGPMQRMRDEGSQRQYFVQGLPGVKYDQFGEPVYGESTPFTTRDPYFSDSSNFALPSTIGGVQGVAPPMAVYNTPTGAMGSRQVAQPYNTSSMYSNLMAPQRYADGGQVQYFSDGGNAAKLPANFNWEQYVALHPDLGRAGIDTQAEAEAQVLVDSSVKLHLAPTIVTTANDLAGGLSYGEATSSKHLGKFELPMKWGKRLRLRAQDFDCLALCRSRLNHFFKFNRIDITSFTSGFFAAI
jgi:hypothetical protein